MPAHDAYDYDRQARSIAAGDGFPPSVHVAEGGPSAWRPPVYPLFVGGVYAASGDSVEAGRLAGAVLGAAAVLLVFLITTRIWGRRVGLVAAGLTAVFPPLVLLSRDLLAEPLFIVLELGAVLSVLVYGRSGRVRWAAAAGVLCGLAALTRNPGVVLAIPIALGVWAVRPRRGPDPSVGGSGTRALAAPAVVVACVALVLAPWAVRNAVEFGRFMPMTSSSGFALAGTYNELLLRRRVEPCRLADADDRARSRCAVPDSGDRRGDARRHAPRRGHELRRRPPRLRRRGDLVEPPAPLPPRRSRRRRRRRGVR